MNCKICNGVSTVLFSARILNKYDTRYYKCGRCEFIQTEEPHWLEEAYASAITSLDLGLLSRNLVLIPITSALINKGFDPSGKFLDYGGGYGVFTRLMRDQGFDYYRYDIHCENLFAKHFDIADTQDGSKFQLATAFEVFEHLVDPKLELEKMLTMTDSVFFSTELAPAGVSGNKDWWYFMPETGQHIAFYSVKSLTYLASLYQLNFYTNGFNLHLLTKKKFSPLTFRLMTKYKAAKVYNWISNRKKSLLMKDYQQVLKNLQKQD
ncbi:class I SAM-dependent methyltransferase [Segetibacter sp. 3557_3]|uniref:class I SAM-dependent methyltransferase n=1 Tax=Segetibacter sp. 3557_3 TaxID=2547429 RepID=UPI001058F3F0|nr:class I SAM-dependent methyltransferase [Segetibacter sp. 3557_3]TDH23322.1 class I SAM-dependent methyltransferase [Segetibacter sp. 3557_3]